MRSSLPPANSANRSLNRPNPAPDLSALSASLALFWHRLVPRSLSLLAASVAFAAANAHAQTFFWTGNGGIANWSTAGNWSPPGPPGFSSNIVFGATRFTTNYNDTVNFFNSITFAPGSAAFVLTGNNIGLDAGGITNFSSALQAITFTGGGGIFLTNFAGPRETWNAVNGDILVTSSVSFAGDTDLILTGAHTITISGVISDGTPDFRSVIVNGPGTVYLNARNTYPGATFVNGGTLGGFGGVSGNLINSSGRVSPGMAGQPGTFTVSGNYTQSPAGTLSIQVAGKNASQFGILTVGQRANLSGNLSIVRLDDTKLKLGQKLTFLVATAGVSGTFASVSNVFSRPGASIVTGKLVYTPFSISLEGTQGSFADLLGLTANQRAVAGALDTFARRNPQSKLVNFLDNESLLKLPGDLRKNVAGSIRFHLQYRRRARQRSDAESPTAHG